MSTYAIGDVQGCYDSLMELLDTISYSSNDTLWFVGDIINRGPKSLDSLRFIKNLPKAQIVLGNHDLSLIATAILKKPLRKGDTIQPILDAHDKIELIDWLRAQPLLIHDKHLDYCMTHAGIPHIWSLNQAQGFAQELHQILSSESMPSFINHMYGNTPAAWSNHLTGVDRYRVITNYFTRMRYINQQGALELNTKERELGNIGDYRPWFEFAGPTMQQTRIIFGHWAALAGVTNNPRIFAIDTGCVWGRKLTALRLDDQQRFSVNAVEDCSNWPF